MISNMAVVETDAVGPGTKIGHYAVVRAGVRLGRNVVIHPHVVIESGVVVGDEVEIFAGAFIGKEPKGAGATTLPQTVAREVTIGARCVIGPNAIIYYDTSIGESTLVGDNAQIRERCVIGNRCVVGAHVSVGYAVQIRDRVKIMEMVHVVGNSLLEEDVFIAPSVGMANDAFVGKMGYEEEHMRGVILRKGVMVGVGATLLPGLEVGEQAVVAAGTVVNIDVPARKLVAGAPAKIMRKIGRPIGTPRK